MSRKRTILIALGVSLAAAAPAEAAWRGWHGFAETAFGVKLSDDRTKHDGFNLLEQRLQLKSAYIFEKGYLADKGGLLRVKGDGWVDAYFGGKTSFELRELDLLFSPTETVDLKIGRQVLTWGTGEYLFVNDQFPKDYVSFFVGRDDEYLKKPSDALKVSWYPDPVNVDLVVLPVFTPNTLPRGDRLSFFDSFRGGIAARDSDRRLIEPPWQASNFEYALRLYRNFGGMEAAFYFFHGFDKNPTGYKNEAARELFYPRIDVYGMSLRGGFAGGITSMEAGYVRSREDPEGTDRLVENSMVKVLFGYAREFRHDWRIGAQYLFEQRLDYAAYARALLPQDFVFDEYHHLLTQRITKQFRNQTVTISVFNFYSPSDRDGYVRPTVVVDLDDHWKLTLGANLPWGEDDITEFGQMKRDKNVYVRCRYSF